MSVYVCVYILGIYKVFGLWGNIADTEALAHTSDMCLSTRVAHAETGNGTTDGRTYE